MLLLDQLTLAMRQIKRQLLESVLIILAITLGVGVIVTVLTLVLGINNQFSSSLTDDYYRTLEIITKEEAAARLGAPLIRIGSELKQTELEITLKEVLDLNQNLPKTMHAYVERYWSAVTPQLLKETASEGFEEFPWLEVNELNIQGVTNSYFAFQDLELVQGDFFLEADLLNQTRVAIVAEALAIDLYGWEDPLGKELLLEGFGGEERFSYTIIGVFKPKYSSEDGYLALREKRTAYVPVTAPPYGFWDENEEQVFNRVQVGVEKELALEQAIEILQGEANLLWQDEAKVRSPLAEFQMIQKELQNYAIIIGLFASVGLVIAVLNILNLLLARVLKRTKAIGLSLALGSSRRLIFSQFLVEAFSLGLIGSLLGIACSFLFAKLLEFVLPLQSFQELIGTRILLGVGLGIVISLLFGVYPAYQGSKINPVDALRTD